MSTTRLARHIHAPRPAVYRALLDPESVQRWMVPDGMMSRVHRFEPHEGGEFRISLTYLAPIGTGKTNAQTDTFHGRFARLVPDCEVVQIVEFETGDPAMQGEMTVTYTLADADGGTEVVGVHENVPPGVSPEDNELGWRMSIDKLARLVESEHRELGAMHLGIADHFGWAIAVTASADHQVVDRRRIELIEPGISPAPIHYESERLDVAATAELVGMARASIARAALAAFDELEATLPAPVVSISLRALPPDFPDDIAVQMRSPYEARADAVMYRQVLVELAHARGWDVHFYVAKDVEGQAANLLGERADEVLSGPRSMLGPPWAKDHRIALAATIVAG